MSEDALKPKFGLVGFFDILGYREFLKANNNDPGQITNAVFSRLLSLEHEQPEQLLKRFPDDQRTFVSSLAQWEWLVFSDTILLTAGFDDMDDNVTRGLRINAFLIQCGILIRYMFDFGMPLRGAIEMGTFFTKGTCFAGEPIVDAYETVSELQIAATVISDKVVKLYNDGDEKGAYPLEKMGLGVRYRVPFRNRESDLYVVLPEFKDDETRWTHLNIKQIVLESFWAHNKQLSESARVKATNTEQFLHFLAMHYASRFK